MRAETGSGLPIPVCWASTSMVSQDLEPFWRAWGNKEEPIPQYTGCVPPWDGNNSGKSRVGGPLGLGLSGAQWQPENLKHCSSRLWVAPSLRPPVVLGVWPDGSDGTDINSLCRSHNERVVAVADDFCKVHLFQYPCARAKVRPLGTIGPRWVGLGPCHCCNCSFFPHLGAKSYVLRPWQPCD